MFIYEKLNREKLKPNPIDIPTIQTIPENPDNFEELHEETQSQSLLKDLKEEDVYDELLNSQRKSLPPFSKKKAFKFKVSKQRALPNYIVNRKQ